MFSQYDTASSAKQIPAEESQSWATELETYLTPYRLRLDAYLDRRVVGNLTAAVAGIVQTRTALTMSGLASAITEPAHARSGYAASAARHPSSGMASRSHRRKRSCGSKRSSDVKSWKASYWLAKRAGQQRKQQERLLVGAARQWKQQVRHVAGSRLWQRCVALAALPL